MQYVTQIKGYARIKKKFAHYEKPMDIIEQRFDFPDYTAKNQEKDARKFEERQKKDIYLVKFKGVYGAYLPRQGGAVCYTGELGDDLTKFYEKAKAFYEELKIDPKFHVVLNRGIEEHIQQQIVIQNLLKER